MNAPEILESKPIEDAAIKTSIGKVQGEIAAFDKIASGIAAIEKAHPKDLAIDVTTTAGMKQAVAARAAWRDPRIAVEKARKAAKAPVLELGKQIDAFAGSLEARLREGEANYDDQIKAEENRKEAERLARVAAEQARIAAIHDRIQKDIVNAVHGAAGQTFARISQIISDIGAMVIGSEFEEFQGQAQLAKDETLDKLREMQADSLAREKEAERVKAEQEAAAAALAAERAELERLRAAEAERVAAAEAEREAAEQEQAARLAAEREAHEAEMRAQREAQERELAAQRAEQARVDAEAAAKRKAEEDEIAARLKALADEREAVAAEQRRQEQIEAQKRAAAEAALNRIERAGPVLLAALKSVKDCGAWNDIEDHVQEQVERAIEEATGQPA